MTPMGVIPAIARGQELSTGLCSRNSINKGMKRDPMRRRLPGVAVALFILPVMSSAPALAKDYGWFGSAKLGAVITSGNTDTQNLNAEIRERYQGKQWRHEFLTTALRSFNESALNAERYLADYKLLYRLLPQSSFYWSARGVRDRFSGFESQYFLTSGYQHLLIEEYNSSLTVEIGVGYTRQQLSDDREQNNLVLRNGVAYSHDFVNNNQFRFDLLVLSNSKNTSATGNIALKARLFGNLGAEMALALSHNTAPPADKKQTDVTTTLGFVYDF